MRSLLREPGLDPAFKDLALTLPSEIYVAEQVSDVDPQRLHVVREAMLDQLATALQADWAWAWDEHQVQGGYRPDAEQSGRRAWPTRPWPCWCAPRRSAASRSGRARPTSASRTPPT
jgi:aminopeptidase N